MKYLHFLNGAAATTRNQAIALERGCGPVTLNWFRVASSPDGRSAFYVEPTHETYLNQAERAALAETLWYQNSLSGDIYVSPDGTQGGDGAVDDPVNLATVCGALSSIAAGATIHVTPGEYIGDFDFIHDGTSRNRIIITFESGARVKGSFTLAGDYVTIQNADVYDTPAERWTDETGSSPELLTHTGIEIFGTNALVTHSKVQDIVSNGVGFWQPSTNSEIYGLWTINNGWNAPDRGHGHGLYTQSQSGTKTVRMNVFAQGYGGGLRAYATNGAIEEFTIDKCVSINDRFLLGGHDPVQTGVVTNNRLWDSTLELGLVDRNNRTILVTDNYIVHSYNACLTLRWWGDITITGNTFVQMTTAQSFWEWRWVDIQNAIIDNNVYYREFSPSGERAFRVINPDGTVTYYTPAQWQALGYDVNSTFTEGLPTVNQVFAEHSEHDNDRAHVAIFNWQRLDAVSVDFAGGNFTSGKTYRAYHAMNPDEYYEFVYDGGAVSIPMTGWSRAIPTGANEPVTEDTWPLFLALVVKPL